LNSTLSDLLGPIDYQKAQWESSSPHLETIESLGEALTLDWTYHSIGLAGNALTLFETKVVLEGITIGGKTLREHLEATNHRDAIGYVEEIVAKREALTEWQIKNIHALVLRGISDRDAGRYRQGNVVIGGASTIPPDAIHLPQEMTALIAWYESANAMHPVERAAELHTRFVKIHPFIDGNGRTGRLLLNFELMKSGYPPAVIRTQDRQTYYRVLDEACVTGVYDGISILVAEAVQRTLTLYLRLIGGSAAPAASTPQP
jgi:Fic family protein